MLKLYESVKFKIKKKVRDGWFVIDAVTLDSRNIPYILNVNNSYHSYSLKMFLYIL
jgi:hypothetical protein